MELLKRLIDALPFVIIKRTKYESLLVDQVYLAKYRELWLKEKYGGKL